MIVTNSDRGTVVGEAVAAPESLAQRLRGFIRPDSRADGKGLLLRRCTLLNTCFRRSPIDAIFLDRHGKVLKSARDVRPFRVVVAPLRSFQALQLPAGAIDGSSTRVGDRLIFLEEDEELIAAA